MSSPSIIDFTTNDAGATVGTAVAASGSPLGLGEQLSINGSTDLSKIIVGHSSALVNAIQFSGDPGGFFEYDVQIQGQGPAGAGSGSLVITVIDGAGGSHSLKLNSSTNKTHSLGFNSSTATINTLSWAPGDV